MRRQVPRLSLRAPYSSRQTQTPNTMTTQYDVIAIGSGHNGLVAAAYLAAAGKKVLVLERQPWFGGGVVTRELTLPGYRHDQHSMAHIFIQANPLLKDDELGLKAKYGLKYVFPDLPMMSIFEDGATLGLYRDRARTQAEIARFSRRDADAYARLAAQAAEWLPMIAASLYAPPVPMGASTAMMDQSPQGRALWRITQMSTHDFLMSWFENDRVRMHFARVAGENLVSPDEKATAIGVFVFVGFLEAYGFGVPVGGSGRLSDALVAYIRDHGGEVVGGADVERVLVRSGRASGVRTRAGAEYLAKDAIIGAIHPHHLGQLVEGVDAEVARAAAATEVSPNACITVHAALKSPLRTRAGEPLRAVMVELLPNEYVQLRRSFDDLRYGGLSQYPLVGLGSLSEFDPTRVPPGAATVHAWDSCRTCVPTGAPGMNASSNMPSACSRTCSASCRISRATMCSSSTATAPSTWSAPRRASCTGICTASRPRLTSRARIARPPSSPSTRSPVSSGSISSVPSCTRAAACSAPGERPRSPCSTISA